MDSLTQITLGAAVGEVVLGRKIGNRALFWGAVGGTIPDLDVFATFIVSPLQDLAWHRGFSHSIVFSILGALAIGYIVHNIYASKYHRYAGFVGWMLIPMAVIFFIQRIFDGSTFSYPLMAALFAGLTFYLYRRYFAREFAAPEAGIKDWQKLFFWALFTHPLLDCFTTYGTQLFQPFSAYRVAFNAISVADPIYTFPFLLLVIAASFLGRTNKWRRMLSWTGIAVSSLYLLFTVINKQRINKVWTNSLEAENIVYSRYMTSPTILNNVLWYCMAETEDGYVHGLYSLYDKEKKVIIQETKRNEDLLSAYEDDPTLKTLKWFCNNYYCITPMEDGMLQFNDMRFGVFDTEDTSPTYIFNFPMKKDDAGYFHLIEVNGGPPPGSRDEMMATLWERIKGI